MRPNAVSVLLSTALCVAFSAGCGSSPPVVEGPQPKLFRPVAVSEPEPERAPPGKLYREDVVRLVDAGFGDFLQKLDVEAELNDGRFVGWNLLALYPPEFWSGVDLKPGDVVTSVNGMPIERETQAFDAFQALKTAPRLTVEFVRGPETRTLSFEIISRPPPSVPTAATATTAAATVPATARVAKR